MKNATVKTKHFVSLVEDHSGREGLAITDAVTPKHAVNRMKMHGLEPLTVPKADPLNFSDVQVTKILDDGDVSARAGGQNYITTNGYGQVYKEVDSQEAERLKGILAKRMHGLQENLKQHPGQLTPFMKKRLSTAPAKVEKMGPMHKTKTGGITRRPVK